MSRSLFFSNSPHLFVLILAFHSFNFVIVPTLGGHDGCQGLLESFAQVTANFTQCFIQNARPIKVCQACIDAFINVRQTYQEILKLHDEVGNPCRLELINVDRLEVVVNGYHFVINQWNRANCNNCFVNQSNSITPEKNKLTQDILVLSDYLQACINNNTPNETVKVAEPHVCDKCKDDYVNLNKFYNDKKAEVHGYCMDIVDMINTTRSTWSVDLGCCSERERPEIIFLVIAITLCFSPLIFYVSTWLSSKKRLLPISRPSRWQDYISASTTDAAASTSTANLIDSVE